jgi:hypothetical protein
MPVTRKDSWTALTDLTCHRFHSLDLSQTLIFCLWNEIFYSGIFRFHYMVSSILNYTHNQRLNMWSLLMFNLEDKAVSKGWQSLRYIPARKLLQWQMGIQIYICQRTEWLLEWAVLNQWLHSKLKDNTEQTDIMVALLDWYSGAARFSP